MIVEIDGDAFHPGRVHATNCSDCGTRAVMFNPYNVDVSCHHCGAQEKDLLQRQTHLEVWKMYNRVGGHSLGEGT